VRYVSGVDGFALIADPSRRAILDRLRVREADVGELTGLLGVSQPLVSKHLRVLRDAGAVNSTIVGKRRVYRLGVDPVPDVLAWVTPFHQLWSHSLARLDRALAAEEHEEQP
jgi:DNA-binding transcriptional ArsR family regulator